MTASTLNKLDQKMSKLSPESLRYKVLVAIRQFRSSWLEVGHLLTDVVYGQDYKEWGYEEFEVYCARELGLKKPTVQKLLASYNYMKTYEPNRLKKHAESGPGEAIPNIPDYQTVELLNRARTRGEDEAAISEFHTRSFEGEEDESTLRNELRDHLRAASPSGNGGGETSVSDLTEKREKAKILRAARTLRQLLTETSLVDADLSKRVESVLVELEEIA